MLFGLKTKLERKKRTERRKRCVLAVVRRSQKISPLRRPLHGARDGQNLISWRWSLHLPTYPVWWRSMHAVSSYRGNRPTHPPANTTRQSTRCKQTGPITIHCAAASAQCNDRSTRWWRNWRRVQPFQHNTSIGHSEMISCQYRASECKVSYCKQIARQHLCDKNLARAGGVV